MKCMQYARFLSNGTLKLCRKCPKNSRKRKKKPNFQPYFKVPVAYREKCIQFIDFQLAVEHIL